MKRAILHLLLLFSVFQAFAIDYYSRSGQANPNALASWNTNPAGGGTAPTSFTGTGNRFIIQTAHTMTTTATWTVGAINSFLVIQSGGTLNGNHRIRLTGTFQILDGGTYVHDNTDEIEPAPDGFSIFAGMESFAPASNFEIRKWFSVGYGIPSNITWGNLIINLQSDMGVEWNWKLTTGNTLNINGNLDIRSTIRELQLSWPGDVTINIGGDLLLSGSSHVVIKKAGIGSVTGYTNTIVNDDIIMSGTAILHLGSVSSTYVGAPVEVYELRYKGDLVATATNTITSSNSTPSSNYTNSLVANGTEQTLNAPLTINCTYRIATGSTVNLAAPVSFSASIECKLVVQGTLNDNGFSLKTGTLEVAGGTFNSSGPLTIDNICVACEGGQPFGAPYATWCGPVGTKGRINFISNTVLIGNGAVGGLHAGYPFFQLSDGEIYFQNATAHIDGISGSMGRLCMNTYGCVLSLDETSYITGNNMIFYGSYGKLRIGSPDGITATGNTSAGNIRTAGPKNYDHQYRTSFEYFGSVPQVTGDGLPQEVSRSLIINNSSGLGTTGVTLSRHTEVYGSFILNAGKLTSSLSNLLTIHDHVLVTYQPGSFVDGHLKKVGYTAFTFPIGEGNEFAPIAISNSNNAGDAFIAKYHRGNPRVAIGAPFENPPIQRMSTLEWWTLDRAQGTYPRQVTLYARTYSSATLLSALRVLRWDGSIWKNEGQTSFSGVAVGPVTSNAVSGFLAAGTPTPFTFGSITLTENPLPVNLISFNAVKLNSAKALLNWQFAAGTSVEKVELERASADRNYKYITTVPVQNNLYSYSYTDNGLQKGVNYYRLKLIEKNGTVSYSKIAVVLNETNGLLLTAVASGPSTARVTVVSPKTQPVDFIIYDMQGRMMQRSKHTVSAGNTMIDLPTDLMAAGAYQVSAVCEDGSVKTIRFLKR